MGVTASHDSTPGVRRDSSAAFVAESLAIQDCNPSMLIPASHTPSISIGSSGVVLRCRIAAKGVDINKLYAVKIPYDNDLTSTVALRERYDRELGIFHMLGRHQNVVGFYGAITGPLPEPLRQFVPRDLTSPRCQVVAEPPWLFAVFDHADSDLGQFLKTTAISADEMFRLGADVLTALTFLQDNNVLHCDVKLDNVLVSASTPRRAMICDFSEAVQVCG